MPYEITIPFSFLVSMRDMLGKARDSSVNAAFLCGELHGVLSETIKRLEKEEPENEETV